MKKGIAAALLTILLAAAALSGCGGSEEGPKGEAGKDSITTGETGIIRDEDYGHIFIDLSIDEFNALGFAFGDSVDLIFDNGEAFEEIPYYSGYYCAAGELLLCGYPGSPYVKFARNYGESTWTEFGMTEDTKVTVILNEKGGYAETQEVNDRQYSDDPEEYDSLAAFANFREIRGGELKEKTFYRSASPCDNYRNRAPYANRFAEEAGIRFVLNLVDNEGEYASYKAEDDFSSAYYDSLWREDCVLFLSLNMNYPSDEFAETIAEAFAEMTEHDGPCLIHCLEGKDRTGFACTLLLALAGADAQEIIDDYMITYDNYYGITEEETPEQYEAVEEDVKGFLWCMCGAEKETPIDTLDLKQGAENYLRRGGLTDDHIAKIEEYIRITTY